MTAKRPRDIGTAVETAVVRYLTANGFCNAERRALRGVQDAGDITGTPGICWSVKGGKAAEQASDLDINRWLDELAQQRFHAEAAIGILVLKRRAFGTIRAGDWWTVVPAWDLHDLITPHNASFYDEIPNPPLRLRLADTVTILRWARYGHPLTGDAS